MKTFEEWWDKLPYSETDPCRGRAKSAWDTRQFEIDDLKNKLVEVEIRIDAIIEQRDKNYEYYEFEIKRLKEMIK